MGNIRVVVMERREKIDEMINKDSEVFSLFKDNIVCKIYFDKPGDSGFQIVISNEEKYIESYLKDIGISPEGLEIKKGKISSIMKTKLNKEDDVLALFSFDDGLYMFGSFQHYYIEAIKA